MPKNKKPVKIQQNQGNLKQQNSSYLKKGKKNRKKLNQKDD